MAFTRNWNEAQPDGSEAASDIDLIIRNLKTDIRERLEDITTFGSNTEPMELDESAVQGVTGTPSARVGKNTSQTISANTGTILTWDQEIYDNGGMVDLGADDTILTIPTDGAGLYLLVGRVQFGPFAGTDIEARAQILVNGSTHTENRITSSNVDYIPIHSVSAFSDGDAFSIEVWHEDTGAVDVDPAFTFFTATRLGII